MAYRAPTTAFSLAISTLILVLTCAPLSPAQAGESLKGGRQDSAAFSLASLKGYYAYGSLAETQAGSGMLKLDGLGNVTTDNITLNLPGAGDRQITPLGPGSGTYTVEPNGVGSLEITFSTLDPPVTYQFEFVVKKAVSDGKRRTPHATEVFTASKTTGVANASVTFISALDRRTSEPVARFNVASLEGRYSYTNNADSFASYGVFVFDGKGNVRSDGKLSVNSPVPPDGRAIVRFGPGYGTYTVDATGIGSFELYVADLGRTFIWNFVITQTSDKARRGATMATGLFSVLASGGSTGQFVAPTLTRIFPD